MEYAFVKDAAARTAYLLLCIQVFKKPKFEYSVHAACAVSWCMYIQEICMLQCTNLV